VTNRIPPPPQKRTYFVNAPLVAQLFFAKIIVNNSGILRKLE
jgi:hypothetical protein